MRRCRPGRRRGCVGINDLIIKTKEHWRKIVDRLTGLAELEHLRESGFGLPHGKDPRDDPRARTLLELGQGLEVMKGLVQLLEADSTVLPVGELLGVSERGPELAGAVERRLDGVLSGLSRALDELEGQPAQPERADFPR